MKQLNDPGPISVVNLLGEPMREVVTGPDGYPEIETVDGQRRQRTKLSRATFKQFCLGLLGTEQFVGDAKGIDAATLVFDTRKAIAAWDEAAGPKQLENEQHRALLRAVKEGKFDQAIAHNLVPYMRAIAEAKDAPPAPVAVPDEPVDQAAE